MATLLTPKQEEIAKWMLEKVQSGLLPEEFTMNWSHKNYQPNYGSISEVIGEQPEISYANMLALESAGLIITAQKNMVPGHKGGVKKLYGSTSYEYSWPQYEKSRTYTITGKCLN